MDAFPKILDDWILIDKFYRVIKKVTHAISQYLLNQLSDPAKILTQLTKIFNLNCIKFQKNLNLGSGTRNVIFTR